MTRLFPAPEDIARHDLQLHGKYVRILGVSPKGRHVHYEVLAPRRRKNQAPRRGWMPLARFLREARPCGHFERTADGDLVWVQPKVAA